MPDEAFEVVGQIGHADFHPGALDTDGTDEQGHARFLGGKDMLDGRAHFGSGGVGPLVPPVHRLALGLAEMDHRLEPGTADRGLVLRRAIVRIGPDRLRDVCGVEHVLERAAVVACRVGYRPFAYEAEGAVDAGVILVAEHRHHDLRRNRRAHLAGFAAL